MIKEGTSDIILNDKSRPAKTGRQMADALISTIHILYLNDDALEYLNALIGKLNKEMERRIKIEYNKFLK